MSSALFSTGDGFGPPITQFHCKNKTRLFISDFISERIIGFLFKNTGGEKMLFSHQKHMAALSS